MSVDTDSLRDLKEQGILQEQVSLAHYTTWRVGGPAQWLAEPNEAQQIPTLLHWAANEGLPVRVIGAGSNLLIADAGLPGLTLCLRRLQGLELNAKTGGCGQVLGNRSRPWQGVRREKDCKGWSGPWASLAPWAEPL